MKNRFDIIGRVSLLVESQIFLARFTFLMV